jgi:glycosyltransferase involved in cell wall biosynthesis
MSSAVRTFRAVVRAIVAVFAAPIILVAALTARPDARRRRASGERPRLIWGPVPVIAIKYWSLAMRERGYESRTCVSGLYSINERSDFDHHHDEFLPRGLIFDPLRAYAVFLWMLRRADVYLSYFDGGFLAGTALRRAELPLLRLAGKLIVVSPYGSDIAVPGHLGPAEERLLQDYPMIARNGPAVRRRVDEFLRWSNLVIRNYQYGYLPRWDVLWPTQIAIDSERWSAEPAASAADGSDGEVVVVHAPNHRWIKGSDRLIEVVERLRSEGVGVRLDLLERRPNEEIRTAIMRSDIVADQFIAGYALFAIEGMAAARPVLSALGWMDDEVASDLRERGLPIVDADLDTLEQRLRELVGDPARRASVGAAGRAFVAANHSYAAVGEVWDELISRVWATR